MKHTVRVLAVSALATLLLMWTQPPLWAQTEDEQLKQQEEQDRRYLERLLHHEQQKELEKLKTSPEAREMPRAELLALADRIIRDTNYSSKTSAHYALKTDDPRIVAGEAVSLLEAFRTWFEAFWAGRLPLRPYSEVSRAYLFYSFNKYNQILTGNPRFGDFRPNGHYQPIEDVIFLHTDSVQPEDLSEVLVHEAAHQLVTYQLYGVARTPSLWVNEGLAGYFGMTLRDAKEGFKAGSIGGKGVSLVRKSDRPGASGAKEQLDVMKRLLRSAPEGYLEGLVRVTDRNVFYGDGAAEHELASWLLVHYLFHGDGGARADAFVQYLKKEIAGEGGADVFFATLGVPPAQLQTSWVEHGRKLKAR